MLNFYERLLRPLLFSLEAETAHHFTIASLRRASHFNPALRALKRFTPPSKPKTLFCLTFPNPIGLAAGLDKNGVALPAWEALGFGFIEIGTVTAMAHDAIRFLEALQLQEIDLLGFSLGGFVAQELTLIRPRLVRRLILAGTGPQGGEDLLGLGPAQRPLRLREQAHGAGEGVRHVRKATSGIGHARRIFAAAR